MSNFMMNILSIFDLFCHFGMVGICCWVAELLNGSAFQAMRCNKEHLIDSSSGILCSMRRAAIVLSNNSQKDVQSECKTHRNNWASNNIWCDWTLDYWCKENTNNTLYFHFPFLWKFTQNWIKKIEKCSRLKIPTHLCKKRERKY